MRRSLLLITILLIIVVISSLIGINIIARPQRKARIGKHEIRIARATILSIGDRTIEVKRGNFTAKLITAGHWIFVANNSAGLSNWSSVSKYLKTGGCMLAFLKLRARNATHLVLIGIRQGGVIAIRVKQAPHLIRKSSRQYFRLAGKVISSSNNTVLVKGRFGRFLAIAVPSSKWLVAGKQSKVSWGSLVGKINKGDLIEVFAHSVIRPRLPILRGLTIVVINRGTLIDLTNGVTATE